MKEEVRAAYVERLIQFASSASRRFHTTAYLFGAVAIVLYLLTAANPAQLQILGATVSIPRVTIMLAAPLILAALFYAMTSFMLLESAATAELKRVLGSKDGNADDSLSARQMIFFEDPSYYTYSMLQDSAALPPFNRALDMAMVVLVLIAHFLIPPAVIGYFIFYGVRELPLGWAAAPYLVSIFLAVLSAAQVIQDFRNP
jgi:hypothetical protein